MFFLNIFVIFFMIPLSKPVIDHSGGKFMRIVRLMMAVYLCAMLTGCADMPTPKASDILKGGNTVRVGMTMSEVRVLYGEPDTKRNVVSKGWGESREEWHYGARISALPASLGYAGEDAYLYFDGTRLTNVSDKPMGKGEAVPGDETSQTYKK